VSAAAGGEVRTEAASGKCEMGCLISSGGRRFKSDERRGDIPAVRESTAFQTTVHDPPQKDLGGDADSGGMGVEGYPAIGRDCLIHGFTLLSKGGILPLGGDRMCLALDLRAESSCGHRMGRCDKV
jgi:hypothetical protein